MSPAHPRVAVIGAGPSGLAAVRALVEENTFEHIRVFERRDRVGGLWIYDAEPDKFPSHSSASENYREAPTEIPGFSPALGEQTSWRTAAYDTLDTNVGAEVMAFTHTPFPRVNSPQSIQRYGPENPSRSYTVVHSYIEELFSQYRHLLQLNTNLEKLEKQNDEWILTLRSPRGEIDGQKVDYWWTEIFDAVVIASGHFNVPYIPSIPGLTEFHQQYPTKLEHSKAFRSARDYEGKRVVIVGGSISAGDLVVDLHSTASSPLYLSQRGSDPILSKTWALPHVQIKAPIEKFLLENNGTIEFSDGIKLSGIDKVIFATGYRLSYPFLQPNPVTESNRLSGFYQHIFRIGDPSLAVVGQVRSSLSFRVYEYQAVAVARVFAGRAKLPSIDQQKEWEQQRLELKGPTYAFHEILLEGEDYFTAIRDIAGSAASESNSYELPAWDPNWFPLAGGVLALKAKYAESLSTVKGDLDTKAAA